MHDAHAHDFGVCTNGRVTRSVSAAREVQRVGRLVGQLGVRAVDGSALAQVVTGAEHDGLGAGVGDRRDEDIRECATIAARMFDHIIIRQEKHLRGRTEDEIIGLIMDGINASGRNVTHEIITKEVEAIKHAINSAQEGTFITALSDVVTNAIEIVQHYLDKENEEGVV